MRAFCGLCILSLVMLNSITSSARAEHQQVTTATEHKKLIVSTIEGHPLVGYATDVMRQVYRKIGFDIEVWQLPAARSLFLSSTGKVDAELGRYGGLSNDYPELIQIKPALVNICLVMLTTDISIKELPSKEKQNKPIAIQRGSVYSSLLVGNRTKIEVNSVGQIIKLLLTGRSNIALVDESYIDLVNESNTLNKIHLVRLESNIYSVYHYVHQRHRNLIPQIQQALLEMQQQGLLKN